MRVADVIDLEAQLARDRDADLGALERRDRALVAASTTASSRDELLRRWLAALREAEPGRLHPGRAVATALAAVRATLVVTGLAAGWGVASVLLRYGGGHPVNVWDILLVLVGLQALLLLFLLASFVFPVATLGAPLVGLFREAIAALYPRLSAGPRGSDEWRALWHRLRSRRSLYRRVEPWLLLGLTQTFGVAFNVGALLACLRLVVLSDIPFAWSTTLLELDAARFHALVRAVAAPWAWLWPDAVPSPALVAATQYSRLEGAYLVAGGASRAADPALVGGWWRFLLAAVATYGLVPRALALGIARLRAARILARLPLDDAEVSRVVARLGEPHVQAGDGAAEPDREPARSTGLPAVPAPSQQGGPCAVLLWRDVPAHPALEAAVARRTGHPVVAMRGVGGRDYEGDGRDLAGLSGELGEVVIVAEGFEAPDRAALRLVRELRAVLGPRRNLRILLVDLAPDGPRPAGDADVRIWRAGLAPLADPYVAVEALGEAP